MGQLSFLHEEQTLRSLCKLTCLLGVPLYQPFSNLNGYTHHLENLVEMQILTQRVWVEPEIALPGSSQRARMLLLWDHTGSSQETLTSVYFDNYAFGVY